MLEALVRPYRASGVLGIACVVIIYDTHRVIYPLPSAPMPPSQEVDNDQDEDERADKTTRNPTGYRGRIRRCRVLAVPAVTAAPAASASSARRSIQKSANF